MKESLKIERLEKIAETVIGMDVGSTTAKLVVVENGEVVYSRYERHFSLVRQKALSMLGDIKEHLKGKKLRFAISGSAGYGIACAIGIPFVQEVFATSETVRAMAPQTDAVVELGGEDAKVIFFTGGTDERMNGSCAGGTGAFIDQMATLLDVTPTELDELARKHRRLYPIASRCGVFAKTDIQPLLNQGASKEDVAASIYQAVVNQTVSGLAQGRRITGNVMFLGGPLYYCRGLRERFKETLQLSDEAAIFPDYALYAVAMGAAIYASTQEVITDIDSLEEALSRTPRTESAAPAHRPLFANDEEYKAFTERHARASVDTVDISSYEGDAYLGIDCGSTTTKLVLMTADQKILYSYYHSNRGNPVEIVRSQLEEIYRLIGDRVKIAGAAVTGYGEELIKNAFHVDYGIVETIAHFTAARHFNPEVDFILDIGGQDIKCFHIANRSIDSIMLNEACSSGCGSFIETFAKSLGYGAEEFSKLGLLSRAPVDLGSRCTVFMNSSVKQAQKDGASVEDISAGLCMSVVKNAIYKVIRASSADELGKHIVVQGGTFLNDAVLRSFELEIGRDVVRPAIAGLMGAYGAALYAQNRIQKDGKQTTVLSREELAAFVHTSRAATCRGCTNHCQLTVNSFGNGEKYISGNQCERGAGISPDRIVTLPNLYEFKRQSLMSLASGEGKRGTIGLPLALGMYEMYPFFHRIFTELGFRVVNSGFSSRNLYMKGQYSIPSDTACYPAKLMHGHIEKLIEEGVDAIFYPCLTYNFDEKMSDNHYNCPVVAYYSELLRSNLDSLSRVKFLYPYLNINDENVLTDGLFAMLEEHFERIPRAEIKRAVKRGYEAHKAHMEAIREEGERAMKFARENGRRILILSGRPYHIDPEINHGIDKLALSLGFVVVSEDAVPTDLPPRRLTVLNQWTYHARLYRAAQYATQHADTELVQLVSFGCGIDAVTTDEVHTILEEGGKLYTQIKIDEITNLGAVKIRLRSLIGALEERADTEAPLECTYTELEEGVHQ
ncbi:MAG: 2-hydroxyacyl-CoA dehydratase [Clostridia bacterium]|nr:2-hydroxyacyl-CoA dehydratase [Clostridia bacterium]